MGVRSSTILARFFCGLSLLLLSAAQQKAFALPAAPPATHDVANREPAKKKKAPLTLRQTLPDAYASRVAGTSANHLAAPGDGRFPPFDPAGERPAAANELSRLDLLSDRPATSARPAEASDIPCLHSFLVCVLRIGPPLWTCAT